MSSIVCPVCGTTTSLNPVTIEEERAYMPDRSSERENVYEKAVVFAIKEAEYPYKVDYGIFQCKACGERFIAKKQDYVDRDWVAVYPVPRKSVSDDVPEPIKGEFKEASLCFAIEAYRACAAMCQITLEAVWRDKGVSNLNELESKEFISSSLRKQADEIRLWGNVAKHEGIPNAVIKEDADQLLTYLEVILNAVYVEPKRFEDLREKRKQIDKKKDEQTTNQTTTR